LLFTYFVNAENTIKLKILLDINEGFIQKFSTNKYYGIWNNTYRDLDFMFEETFKNTYSYKWFDNGLNNNINFYKCYTFYSSVNNSLEPLKTRLIDNFEMAHLVFNLNNTNYYLFIHSNRDFIPEFNFKNYLFLFNKEINNAILLRMSKITRIYLQYPYRSNCGYYDNIALQPFHSKSFEHCMRKCIINHCSHDLKCHVWNVSGIVFLLDDEKSTPYPYCSVQQNINCTKNIISRNISKLCKNICPIDCINDAFYVVKSKNFVNYYSRKKLIYFM